LGPPSAGGGTYAGEICPLTPCFDAHASGSILAPLQTLRYK
jgi:hypothetical protein